MDLVTTYAGAVTFGPLSTKAALSDFDLEKEGHWETGPGPAHFTDAGREWALGKYSKAVGESLWAIPHNKTKTQTQLTSVARQYLATKDKRCNGSHTFLMPCDHGTKIIKYQRVIERSDLSKIDKEQASILGAALARDHYYRPTTDTASSPSEDPKLANLTRKQKRAMAKTSAQSKGSATSEGKSSRAESQRSNTQIQAEAQQTVGASGVSVGKFLAQGARLAGL